MHCDDVGNQHNVSGRSIAFSVPPVLFCWVLNFHPPSRPLFLLYIYFAARRAYKILICLCLFFSFALQNPGYMKENFYIIIESLHLGDTGEQENVSPPTY